MCLISKAKQPLLYPKYVLKTQYEPKFIVHQKVKSTTGFSCDNIARL